METGNVPTSTLSGWRSIWSRPQATIRDLVRRDDRSHVLLLAAIAGICSTIAIVSASPHIHWLAVVVVALLLGPLLGILNLYVSGALLAWTGRLLGGRAGQPALRTATAWALAPQIIALPILLASIAAFEQAFLHAYGGASRNEDPVFLTIQLFLLVLSTWSLVLAVRTVGAVQGFGIMRAIANALSPLLALLVAATLIRIFLFQPFSVAAGSMKPTLLLYDYVFANKTSYGYSQYSSPIGPGFSGRIWPAEPVRGDVVVFRHPSEPRTDYIKRIVGLPGDEVQMTAGVLYINGAPTPKDYVDDVSDTECDASSGRCMQATYKRYRETLPGGATYMVLDLEPNGDYDNTPVFKVPPGHYFTMGDNRDNSNDSRATIGYVPYENLIGRLSVIYFSAEPLGDTQAKRDAFNNIRWNRIFQVPR